MVDELGVPVKFVGVGEGIEDLQVGKMQAVLRWDRAHRGSHRLS